MAFVVKFMDGLVALAGAVADPAGRARSCGQGRRDERGLHVLGREGRLVLGRLGQQRAVAGDGPLDGLDEVVEQVPAVRALDGVGCSGACAVGVGGSAVAADDLDTGVVGQPGGKGGGLTVRQNIDGVVGVDIDQDRAVGVPPAEGEVVHCEHLGRGLVRFSGRARMSRSRVSRPAVMPSSLASRAPARPASARAILASASRWWSVR
nr:hypothetical protein [Streptomyces sp. YIM 98790]